MNVLTAEIIAFRDAREWGQFHTPPQLAAALSIEAAELQETMLWGKPPSSRTTLELADVLIYALTLCHDLGLDPEDIVRGKLEFNAERYPVEKSRGNATKWSDL